MQLSEWAARWNIPPAALADLKRSMGVAEPPVVRVPGVSEAAAQQAIRLEAPRLGLRLWRNNNGATLDESGRMIRFGLANDSVAMSRAMKSSDLIGITPRHIGGETVGVFTSVEVKRPGWRYAGTVREQAQLKWIQLIISLGGRAQFATGPEDLQP